MPVALGPDVLHLLGDVLNSLIALAALTRVSKSFNQIVRIVKSTMLDFIVLQCRNHYLSMFLTISQPPDLTTEPATWSF
jgi:hypothetical protein